MSCLFLGAWGYEGGRGERGNCIWFLLNTILNVKILNETLRTSIAGNWKVVKNDPRNNTAFLHFSNLINRPHRQILWKLSTTRKRWFFTKSGLENAEIVLWRRQTHQTTGLRLVFLQSTTLTSQKCFLGPENAVKVGKSPKFSMFFFAVFARLFVIFQL